MRDLARPVPSTGIGRIDMSVESVNCSREDGLGASKMSCSRFRLGTQVRVPLCSLPFASQRSASFLVFREPQVLPGIA